MKQVICMKWGRLYDPEYVNKLYYMVRANTSGQLRFVCLTDDPTGIIDSVECFECPTIPIPDPYSKLGWRKIVLFKNGESLFDFEGDWLFLDLDVVITSKMDCFFEFLPEKSFVVMRNWTQPKKNIGNTSVYRFRIGSDSGLYTNLVCNYKEVLDKYRNSQTYISDNIKELHFWPDKWCRLFKHDCVPSWPSRFWKEPTIPEKSIVIAFPGNPNPHEAAVGRWPVKKPYKKIYKYIKPVSWISRVWSEAENNAKKK